MQGTPFWPLPKRAETFNKPALGRLVAQHLVIQLVVAQVSVNQFAVKRSDMRKALIIGLIVPVAVAGAIGWALFHARNPIASAKQQMSRGNMRGAEQYLRQALSEHPLNPTAAFLLGEVDLELGNPEAAELELKRARDRGYDRVAIVLPLGQAYLQERHFDEALRDFDPATAPAAELPDVLSIRAAAQLALGDLSAASATSAKAESLAPKQRETLLIAARVALARNDLAGASDRISRQLASKPADQDALLLRAEVAMRRSDAKSALADAHTVLAASAGRPDALLIEGRALAALGRAPEARAALAKVLRVAPRNIIANFLDASLAIEAGDYASSDTSLTRIGAVIDKLPRGFYLLAITKLGLGQTAQAEEAVSKFLVKAPDDAPGLKLLALVELARRRPADALTTLRQAPLASHPDSDTLDLTGQAQAMSGDLPAARGSFAGAAQLAPKNTAILNRLAAIQLGLGDSTAAEADLRRSLKIDPDQQLAGETMVQAAVARGDFTVARDEVAHLRQTMGDDATVGVLDAQVKLAALDVDGAESQLHDVLAKHPDSRQAALALVRIDTLRGNRDAAVAQLTDLLHRTPADDVALNLLLPRLIAANQLDQAIAAAEASHTAAPDNVAITGALADVYVRAHQVPRALALLDRTGAQASPQLEALRARLLAANGKRDEAERAYRDLLDHNPDNVAIRDGLAALLSGDKHYDEARDILREGLAQHPGAPALLGAIVGIDLRQGGIKQALSSAAALRADPHNRPAADSLAGDAWLASGDRPQAAAAYQLAYQAAPTTELAARAATTLGNSGKLPEGIALLADWSAKHPDDINAQAILGSLLISANRLGDAAEHLDAALTMRPNDAMSLNNLAWIKQQQGDVAAARKLAERAYFQSPSPVVADTLGWILAQQGDVKTALPLLASAVNSTDPVAQADAAYHYGYALNQAGRRDEARAQLRTATQTKVEFANRAAAAKLLATLN